MDSVTGIGSVPELAFLTQLFVLGSAAGMVYAIVQHRRTGRLDEWPLHVAYGGLLLLIVGTIFLLVDALS